MVNQKRRWNEFLLRMVKYSSLLFIFIVDFRFKVVQDSTAAFQYNKRLEKCRINKMF